MVQFYKDIVHFYRHELKQYFRIIGIVCITLTFLWVIFGFSLIDRFQFLEVYEEDTFVFAEHGDALALFFHNVRATFLSMAVGVVPLLFLTLFFILVNISVLGSVIASVGYMVDQVFLVFLLGIVPHGIFEIPALILSFAMGIYLCKKITWVLFKKERVSLKIVMRNCLMLYVGVVVPLLVIAALVEAYITPYLLNTFL